MRRISVTFEIEHERVAFPRSGTYVYKIKFTQALKGWHVGFQRDGKTGSMLYFFQTINTPTFNDALRYFEKSKSDGIEFHKLSAT